MKDQNDKQTKEMLEDLEISHGYFDKRWCKKCEEYRHFHVTGKGDGFNIVQCSRCDNSLFVDE